MNNDGDVDEFMAEDRRMNPSCNYSYSNQRRCQSVNGKSVCEVLNRVMRMCPGKAPVEIYANNTKEDSDAGNFSSSSGGSSMFPDHDAFPVPRAFEDPLSLFGSMLQEFTRPGFPPGFPGAPRNHGGFFEDDDEPKFSVPERDHRSFGGLFGPPKSSQPPIKGEVSGPIERI
jgi:hypothetical protein